MQSIMKNIVLVDWKQMFYKTKFTTTILPTLTLQFMTMEAHLLTPKHQNVGLLVAHFGLMTA